ncbi:carbohydrate ABC transporter permease [Kineococcus radiotolerans]|uniref:Binding-protein-dependent transport systems inner membrane component n=1 Tax=Kineococcus radiotolerans (strain ATCC BAA-149 / DSM 14245 / SRS30216) TaxID=266940 RepID=A6WA72_KINRD|nr:sugar ABC transporter permease [Kineococcus radiotolerans]ABS03711.1 binding-protein-dependent transport systems inner membrane component [Kineococcus radiotolerans SRS30216 = ATCC BAA-149]
MADARLAVPAAPTAATKAPPRTPRRRRSGRSAFLFLLPWILGFVFITAGPLIASLYLSFTNYNLLEPAVWTGLSNYRQLFTADPRFYTSLAVTGVYVAVSVPLQLAFALALAVFLDKGIRGLNFYRSVFYLPSLIGGSVGVGLLWYTVFGYDGGVNQVLRGLGFSDLPNWIGNPDTSLGTIVLLHVWTFGSPMVIFMAGLRQIPAELYEQAGLDGAGRFKQFRHVTVPLLTPIIFFNLVLQLIQAFQAFTPAYVISRGTGGPADSTMFYTLYLYIQGFTRFDMGYASAMGWILLLIIAIFTGLNFLFSKYWVFYND